MVIVIDLNFELAFLPFPAVPIPRHELRMRSVQSDDRSFVPSRLPQMRGPLRRQSPGPHVQLLGSVPVHGLCPVHFPRVAARHCFLSALGRLGLVSPGHPRQCLAQHLGRRQRIARLAHLRRFRSDPDRYGPGTLSRSGPGDCSEPEGLCLGFDNHRPVHEPVPLGLVQAAAACDQASHPTRPARQYPDVSAHFSGKKPTT